MKPLFVFMGLLLSFSACASEPGPLGKETIEIDDFDFSTNISTILPDSYKNRDYEGSYHVPSSDGTTNIMLREGRPRFQDSIEWYEYRSRSVSHGDKLLRMAGQTFNAANFAAALDGQIFLVSGYAYKIAAEQSAALIERLTKEYGESMQTRGKFFGEREYDLYTWTLEDRTIKYAVVETDQSNELKLDIPLDESGNPTDLREGERQPHLKGYLFVIDASWVERFRDVSGRSGDMVYYD